MDLLLYTEATSATGRVLARALGFTGSRTYQRDVPPRNLIRWGSSTGISRRAALTLNKKAAIALATDKMASLEKFTTVGVPHPPFIRLNREQLQNAPGFLPALARNINHTQGRDIILCLQYSDLVRAMGQGRTFAVKYIPTKTEYRLHVFGNEIIKTSEKHLRNADAYIPWLRNFEHGYAFRQPENQPSFVAKQTAIAAVQALGLDFGAVDLIISDNGMPFVLEVNTGPGLVESSAKKYVAKFKERFNIPDANINLEVLAELNNENED